MHRMWLHAALVLGILVVSCGPAARYPLSRLDSAEHHAFAGIVLLNREKIADAGREFEWALRLDPQHAKALAGAGLVKAYGGDFRGGLDAMERSLHHARSREDRLFALIGVVRVNLLSHAACLKIGTDCGPDDTWLRRSREAFEQAVLIDHRDASAYYFMGECYLAALDADTAGRMFARVLDLNAEYVHEAQQRWKLVRKIRRAMPETVTGRKAALAERMTRADVAALLMEELKIGALFARRAAKGAGTAVGQTGKAANAAGNREATDIARDPIRATIEGVIRLGIGGLGVYPDGTFRPDEPVDRVSYAMILDEILMTATGDMVPAGRYTGMPSPFSDLWGDTPGFPAAMTVVSKGIMELADPATGSFAPYSPLSGVDALLAVRNMEKEIRYR
ncbi:MAG: S-layer homology domain-containing protein [Thermodesulfobacteriota bacterium]